MVPRIWWATSPISCSQHLTFHYYSMRMLIHFFLARPCIPKVSFVFVLFFPGMVQHQHQPVPRRASWLKMWKFTLCTAQHQHQPTNQDQPAPTSTPTSAKKGKLLEDVQVHNENSRAPVWPTTSLFASKAMKFCKRMDLWKNAFQKSKFGLSVFVRPDLTSGVVSLEPGSIKENALLNMHCFV